jgi:hypothetical protein
MTFTPRQGGSFTADPDIGPPPFGGSAFRGQAVAQRASGSWAREKISSLR